MRRKFNISSHVLFPENGSPNSKILESAGLSYSMFKALGANETMLELNTFENVKKVLDEINENEEKVIFLDLSQLENMSIEGLRERLTGYGIDNAISECIKYKGGRKISYLELFCMIWNEQRYPKLCILLGG